MFSRVTERFADRFSGWQLSPAAVRALALVAVVVAGFAAVVAWRGRPTVEPVEPLPPVVAPAPPSAATIVVAVSGLVAHPGLVRLPAGARVADALEAAGGVLPGVDISTLNLARKLIDGELILVGVTPLPLAAGGDGAPADAGPVNLNTATSAQLQTLPGIGPVLADRIIAYREAHGGFATVADLRKVSGIGDARYAELKDLVTV